MLRTFDIEHETNSLDKEDALDAQSQDRKSRKRTFLSLCGNKKEEADGLLCLLFCANFSLLGLVIFFQCRAKFHVDASSDTFS